MKCRLDDFGDIFISLVAGISVAYFFLELLPILTIDLLDPSHAILTFFFILFGFTSIHIAEKLILQRVESKTRERINELDFFIDHPAKPREIDWQEIKKKAGIQ